MEYVKVEREGEVAVLILDRQDALNALNPQVQRELIEALTELREDEHRALVVTGAGDQAFVAGADIQAMREMSVLEAKAFSEQGQEVMSLLERNPAPTIAAINGPALGGGTEIALSCDIRIAAENALLGFPEVSLGIMPGAGGTQRLPRLVGPGIAKDMVFTGRRIKAEEARTINLVDRVVPEGEALNAAKELATEIAANGPIAVRHAKAALNRAFDVDLARGLEFETDQFAVLFSTEDAKEGMGAFAEGREANFQGL